MRVRREGVLVVAVLALAACGGSGSSEATVAAAATTDPPEPTAFEKVIENCEVEEAALMDDGASLTLDGRGKDDALFENGVLSYTPGTLAPSDLGCALGNIGTPESTIAKMEQTRALDGMQTDTSGGYPYTWTYHPDNGLDIIITEDDE